jgi:hypothetical protein
MGGADARILEGQALEVGRDPEHRVHRREHGPHGAEGEGEPHVLEGEVGRRHLGAPVTAARLELLGRGSLKAVDRLLGVAHGEEGAGAPAPGPVPGGEVLRDEAQDLPLLGVGVLRLVDQHVVDAAVELVEHPVAVAPGQERQGLGDEVVEVERPEPGLLAVDPAGDLPGEGEERAGALHRADRLAAVVQRDEAGLLDDELVLQRRIDRLRHERALGSRLELLGEEDRQVVPQPLLVGGGLGGRDERRGALLVGRLAPLERLDQGRPARGRKALLDHRPLDALDCLVRIEPQRRLEAAQRRADPARVLQHLLAPDRRLDRGGEAVPGCVDADQVQRVREVAARALSRVRHHVGEGRGEHLAALALVEHREAGRHVRLEGDEVQKALAEGVDGVDLEPARGLHRPGEEGARRPQAVASRGLALQGLQLAGERRIVQRHPAPEPLEHPDRHVGGGGLGEGEAQDPAGRRAGEEQAQHPVGEHLGLARAGVRRHPGGRPRVRGPALVVDRLVRDVEAAGHAPSSSTPLASDHSFTRAR